MIIEYVPLKKTTGNFALAKTAGVCLAIFLVPTIFYSYAAITGDSILIADISTFVVAVIIGQTLSYKLLTRRKLSENLSRMSLVLLALLGVAFVPFSFCPPRLPVFRDPITGKNGIL